ncbi:MAG: hypothetical protein EZS28_001018 [Streblomastix strix]|uniref:Uncharacterized protein n=1 Tax=Streblomastix strix TaxID=222440 RepID=A0A5J4X883_9EUKA|nr:MAG: hypothetical protein EZS28_001018 [Streblomastix strix]
MQEVILQIQKVNEGSFSSIQSYVPSGDKDDGIIEDEGDRIQFVVLSVANDEVVGKLITFLYAVDDDGNQKGGEEVSFYSFEGDALRTKAPLSLKWTLSVGCGAVNIDNIDWSAYDIIIFYPIFYPIFQLIFVLFVYPIEGIHYPPYQQYPALVRIETGLIQRGNEGEREAEETGDGEGKKEGEQKDVKCGV